jgi:hypothetical protein
MNSPEVRPITSTDDILIPQYNYASSPNPAYSDQLGYALAENVQISLETSYKVPQAIKLAQQEVGVNGLATPVGTPTGNYPYDPSKASATLSALTVSEGTLSPNFDPEITDYTVTVPYRVDTLEVSAIANDEDATVSGTGTKDVTVGENNYTIVVTAKNGTIKTYSITVTREADAPVETDAEFLRERSAAILNEGLSGDNLLLDGKVLTLVIDGREFILSTKANNRNINGEIALNNGYYLQFDIKGNGKNIKVFKVVQK